MFMNSLYNKCFCYQARHQLPSYSCEQEWQHTLLIHCLYYMSPFNHERTTSSTASSIFYVAKKLAIKRKMVPH